MFCPNCGTEVNQGLKFCKRCGTNLFGVRDAMVRGDGFNWNKFAADFFKTEEESDERREEKRYNEIKGGVITAAVGLGAMIFLRVFMSAVAANEPNDAELLNRLWIAGIVPFLVGLSIIFNGVYLSKLAIQARRQKQSVPTSELEGARPPAVLPEAFPNAPDFSIAEPTTRRIPEPAERPSSTESK